MNAAIALAGLAGILIGLSRQLNGRLSLATSPLVSSFWNHIVGFAVVAAVGLAIGGLLPQGAYDAPWYAFLGGPIGVVFIAAGNWVIARIGAVNTALLIISGQMMSGVALDLLRAASPSLLASSLGIVLILAGVAVTQRRPPVPPQDPDA